MMGITRSQVLAWLFWALCGAVGVDCCDLAIPELAVGESQLFFLEPAIVCWCEVKLLMQKFLKCTLHVSSISVKVWYDLETYVCIYIYIHIYSYILIKINKRNMMIHRCLTLHIMHLRALRPSPLPPRSIQVRRARGWKPLLHPPQDSWDMLRRWAPQFERGYFMQNTCS